MGQDEVQLAPAGEPEPVYERSVRATALGRGTSGVPEVRRLVEDAFATACPRRIWVAGQVAQVHRDDEGGVHFRLRAAVEEQEPFELLCQATPDTVPQLAEVLDRVHDADFDDVVLEGRLARAGGLLRFEVYAGTPVLYVTALDPAPTERGLAEDRARGLAAVHSRRLPDRQRHRSGRPAPLRVALAGADDDPAVARVRERLVDSGFALRLHDAAVPVRGPGGPAALGAAVREAALRSDLVLLVREQGRPLGLGLYDTREVAQAVADAPVPVVTALGGAGETTVTDAVAHACLPSADDAATWLLTRLGEAERSLRELRDEVVGDVRAASGRARADLDEQRSAVVAEGEAAEARAAQAHRKLWIRVLSVSGLLAAALLAAAVVAGRPLLLTGLLVLAAVVAGAWYWSTRAPRRGIRGMGTQDDEFAGVLEHLHEVREQLARTSSPETVRRLRELGAQLVGRGESILGRDLDAPAQRVDPSDARTVPASGPARVLRLDDPDATQVLPVAHSSG